MRKLIPPVAALLACAALSAALSYAAAAPKNLDRAIEVQRALVAQRPADSGAANDLGSLLVLAEDAAGAEAAYRSAIAIDGANAAAHFNLGLLLQKAGDRRAALKEFKRALEIQPRHAWAQYQIGTVYHQQGHESAARKAYAKALALDPALGNPTVNPHLVDNELATSAMLYAYHHYREELQPEKQFEEPARIAGVLIDRPESSEGSAATAEGAAAPEGGFVRGTGARRTPPMAPASRARSRSRSRRRTIRRRVPPSAPCPARISIRRVPQSDQRRHRAGARRRHGQEPGWGDHLRQPRPDPRHPTAGASDPAHPAEPQCAAAGPAALHLPADQRQHRHDRDPRGRDRRVELTLRVAGHDHVGIGSDFWAAPICPWPPWRGSAEVHEVVAPRLLS